MISLNRVFEKGDDVPVALALERDAASPLVAGVPYVRSDFTSVVFTLLRLYRGKIGAVEDYESVTLEKNDCLYNTMQGWSLDTIGYNFRHVIDESILYPVADYIACYDFTLTSGESFTEYVKFPYRGPVDFGALATSFTGTPGPAGQDGTGFDFKEAWSSSTQYAVNDVVLYQNALWLATAVNSNVTPVAGDDWAVFLPAGTGTTGNTGPAGPGYTATSTSSRSIGITPTSWTTQSGLAYTVGARVRVSSSASPTNWAEGIVLSYSSTTLSVDVDKINGSGTFASWNINIAGEPGEQGEEASATASILFTQTATVTVENTTTKTTLIGAGSGTNEIAALSSLAGDKFYIDAAGYYSTKLNSPGTATIEFSFGTEVVLAFPAAALIGGKSNARWKLNATMTRRTVGSSGLVVAEGELSIDISGVTVSFVGTTSALTMTTVDARTPTLTVQWSTADSSNSWKCQQYEFSKAGVATE